ncbi:MAG TPA: hypothetical protein VNC59_04720 [Thermoanaerobaculia bacterium]|nr:hypothetical protein [Thermoanaerobaculia bacterium]
MTTTRNSRHRGILFSAVALFAFLTLAPAVEAQRRTRQDRVTNAGYQRMRQFARQLDELARDANRQAQADQAGYRGIRRDTKFLNSIGHFAKRAREFRAKMETYRTRPWSVDEEVEHLLRDARDVQKRIGRARYADARTRQEWAQVVNLLDNLRDEYLYGGRNVHNRNNPNRYPGTYDDRDVYDRDRDVYDRDRDVYDRDRGVYDRDRGVYDRDPYAYGSTDMRRLAYELDQRASRAAQLAGGSSGYGRYSDYDEIREFSEEAREFRALVDQNRLTQSQLRSEVNELLEDAQDAYDDLRRANISRELANEWDAVVEILNRMRALVIA